METTRFTTPEACVKLKGSHITCGPPDNHLYSFVGTFHIPTELASDLVLTHDIIVEENDTSTAQHPQFFEFPLGYVLEFFTITFFQKG
jgi:hypothetical protein